MPREVSAARDSGGTASRIAGGGVGGRAIFPGWRLARLGSQALPWAVLFNAFGVDLHVPIIPEEPGLSPCGSINQQAVTPRVIAAESVR
jgi:hypothetical protein